MLKKWQALFVASDLLDLLFSVHVYYQVSEEFPVLYIFIIILEA